LLSLPLVIPLLGTVYSTTEGPPMNKALAGTARLALVFSVLFSIGLVLSRLLAS
jgi:1,4-dihydroxy-2-naphthoate octaprenyltransferase